MNDIVPSSFNTLANSGGNDYNEELAAFLGQGGGQQILMLPELKVNKDYEDDEENGVKLTPGTFVIVDSDGVEHYSKKALFRPFMNTFQVTEYDPDEKKFRGKTVQIKDWSEEMVDTLGGIRMGKLKAKEKKELDKDDPRVKADKNKNMYRLIYGTVRMPDAVGRNGKKAPLTEAIPCVFKRTGTNFMPYDEEYLSIIQKAKKLQPNFETTVTLERHKNGDVVYYVSHFDFNQNETIPFKPEDFELLKKFQETIDFENAEVWKAYNKAVGKSQKTAEDDNFVRDFASGDLDGDFPDSDI
jgi:hypothetical protein